MPVFRRAGRPGLIGLAARTAVVAGTATAVSGAVHSSQQGRAQAQAQQQQAAAAQQQAQIDAAAQAAVSQAAVSQAAASQAAAQATPASAAPPADDLIASLQKLAGLKDAGMLTDEEFAAAKARLLG